MTLRKPRGKRGTHRNDPPRWRILQDLPPRAGDDYALCECARGHVQAVCIDVRPQPPCNQCLGYVRKHTAKRPLARAANKHA